MTKIGEMWAVDILRHKTDKYSKSHDTANTKLIFVRKKIEKNVITLSLNKVLHTKN